MCVNNQRYLQEALYYIDRLNIPDGYEIDILTVTDAKSMAAGYNEVMRNTDAKYKLYLHQDVFLLNRDILYSILEIFSNDAVGMIGLVGCPELPDNCMQWYNFYFGSFISNNYSSSTCTKGSCRNAISCAASIDGLFMATQYDLPWREDIFDGWDFYDVSQSFEFRKAGYEVVVPYQEEPWVMHYDGVLNLRNYYKYRKIFMKEYL